MSFLFGQNHSK